MTNQKNTDYICISKEFEGPVPSFFEKNSIAEGRKNRQQCQLFPFFRIRIVVNRERIEMVEEITYANLLLDTKEEF